MSDTGCAIIGMACIFPGASDLASFWRNLQAGVDSISEVPAARWDPVFYDPKSREADRLPCKRGGFIDAYAHFDPLAHGIMPVAARQAEPDQLLALQVAGLALQDAGYASTGKYRERTGVVLGRGNYAGSGRIRLEQHMRVAEQLASALRDLLPGLETDAIARVKQEFQTAIGAAGADGVIGLVPNLTASRIAERLDLTGPAYTLDAACASTLLAVDRACQDLTTQRADLMLCGGVHVCHAESFWSVFAQLGALSRTEMIRPFDERADGILIGEGVGILVLKRLADALRDDDRVYAVLRGIGTSSDGKGTSLMSPSVAGQVLALQRAWSESGRSPDELGMLEAHGTATAAGDAVEIDALLQFFGGPRATSVGLGSVKSNIGHAMPAAGAAGLIKAALAVAHGVKPQTLHADRPRALLRDTRFGLLQQTTHWQQKHRIAAVSAFGFGGINAHVVLESAPPRTRAQLRPRPGLPTCLLIEGDSAEQLLEALRTGSAKQGGAQRLALLDPSPARIERARKLVLRGKRSHHDGISYAPTRLLTHGRLACLFPGFDAGFQPNVATVAEMLGVPAPSISTGSLEETGVAITAVNQLLYKALQHLGVRPELVAGHSIGEWSAMVAAGVLQAEHLDAFNRGLRPGLLPISDALYCVAGCDLERARAAIRGLDEIDISHDNCPHQVILCGSPHAIELASQRLRAANVLVQSLPFGSGVHSRFFSTQLASHADTLRNFEFSRATLPIYSATSCQPYPEDPKAICELTIRHLVERVRFRELIERMYADGARVFVQVGMGSLVAFAQDTLRASDHLALAGHARNVPALDQLRHVACALWAEGAQVRFDSLLERSGAKRPASAPMTLSLGVPLVRFSSPLKVHGTAPSLNTAEPVDAVALAYRACLTSQLAAQTAVLTAWRQRAVTNPVKPVRTTLRRRISLDEFPELLDHAFFRQPTNWKSTADRAPVVPMTGLLELMREAAAQIAPEKKLVGFERVWAKNWLNVTNPVDLEIHCQWDGKDCIEIQIEGYAQAVIRLGTDYPASQPAAPPALYDERPASISAARVYTDRWMFHGPAYQGIAQLGPIAIDGIRGQLRRGPALGALLDNAGQLLGYWMLVQPSRAMAMPIRIARIQFHRPESPVGSLIDCVVQVDEVSSEHVICNMQLTTESGLWATIEGWEDRCVPVDERLWGIITAPESSALCESPVPGLSILHGNYKAALAQQYVEGRYLTDHEKALLSSQPPHRRRAMVGHWVAAKDAVRTKLWSEGHAAVFPCEVTLVDGASAHFVCHVGTRLPLHVTTDSCEGLHAAFASSRPAAFAAVAKASAQAPTRTNERKTIEADGDVYAWRARLWAAKSAIARAAGYPDADSVQAEERRGERFLIEGRWLRTLIHGEYAIAWSEP